MNIPTQADLVRQIDDFLARHDMKPSRLSRDATGEPGLIDAIREGRRSPTLNTVEKLATYMVRLDAEAATRAKLDALLEITAAHPEEEHELPFVPAPVNRTGASSPTCSRTSAPRPMPAASGSCPSCSAEGGELLPVAGPSTPTEAGAA